MHERSDSVALLPPASSLLRQRCRRSRDRLQACTRRLSTLSITSGKRRLLQRVRQDDPELTYVRWCDDVQRRQRACDHCEGAELGLLFKALERNHHVDSLDLSKLNVGRGSLAALSSALVANGMLQTLCLDHVQLDVGGFQALAAAIASSRTLTRLSLRRCGAGLKGVQALANALQRSSTSSLQVLSLRDNYAYTGGISSLASALPRLCSLLCLDLQSTTAGESGIMSLSTFLRRPDCPLLSLNVANNFAGDVGVSSLADAIVDNRRSRLRCIDVTGNVCGIAGATRFAAAIAASTILQSIGLARNEIHDEGALALADALRLNASLRHLNVSSNKIGWTGMNALLLALNANASVSSLEVSLNRATLPAMQLCAFQLRNAANRKLRQVLAELMGVRDRRQNEHCPDDEMLQIPSHELHCVTCVSLRSEMARFDSRRTPCKVLKLIQAFVGEKL